MGIKKVAELEGNYIEFVVSDTISKDQYFDDCEIAGWLIQNENQSPAVYHLYRRGHDEEKNEPVDEPMIFMNESLQGEVLENEIQTMLAEAEMQHHSGENKEILNTLQSIFAK